MPEPEPTPAVIGAMYVRRGVRSAAYCLVVVDVGDQNVCVFCQWADGTSEFPGWTPRRSFEATHVRASLVSAYEPVESPDGR